MAVWEGSLDGRRLEYMMEMVWHENDSLIQYKRWIHLGWCIAFRSNRTPAMLGMTDVYLDTM